MGALASSREGRTGTRTTAPAIRRPPHPRAAPSRPEGDSRCAQRGAPGASRPRRTTRWPDSQARRRRAPADDEDPTVGECRGGVVRVGGDRRWSIAERLRGGIPDLRAGGVAPVPPTTRPARHRAAIAVIAPRGCREAPCRSVNRRSWIPRIFRGPHVARPAVSADEQDASIWQQDGRVVHARVRHRSGRAERAGTLDRSPRIGPGLRGVG